MKKTIIIILISVIYFINNVNAQDFRFGLNASPGIKWLKSDSKDYEKIGMGISFAYGVDGEFRLSDNFSFATGLQISYQGGKIKYPDTASVTQANNVIVLDTGFITRNHVLQYFEIPITLKMKTNEIGYITYFAKFGFCPGYAIKAFGTDKFEYDANSIDYGKQDVIKKINNIRIAMVISGGIEYSLGGSTSLIVGATFNNGFSDVLKGKNNYVNKTTAHKATNNFIALNLGILF